MSRRSGERVLQAEISEPLTGFDYLVEWVLAVALLFSPLAFGATNAWSQQLLYVLVALLAVIVGIKLSVIRGTSFVFTWAFVPIILYLLLVAVSVIPLPAGVVQVISPGTVESKTKLLSDIPNVKELLSRLTISYNVWDSERGLRMVLALGVVFAAVVNVYRTPSQIKRLLGTIAAVGAVVALLTLAQDITHIEGKPYQIYWTFDAVHANAGPFAGHGQLGQYLNLTIGAMVALALVQIGEAFSGEDPTAREVLERLNTAPLRIALLLGVLILASAAAIAWAVTIGAMISMSVAGLVVLALIFYKRGFRQKDLPIICSIALVVILIVVCAYELLLPRLPYINGTAAGNGGARVAIVKTMSPMFHTWPVMGTGLNSFEWVFPMFERGKTTPEFFQYAENDYAQTLSDTGIIGAVLTALFLAIIFWNWLKSFLARQPIQLASIGIAYSILAVMIHSTSDFSQRTPAIALVSSVLVGLVVSLSRMAKAAPAEVAEPSFGWTPWPRIAGALVVLAAMGWSIWSINGIRRAEFTALESDPTYFGLKTRPTDPDYAKQLHDYYAEPIALDREAIRLDPQNIQYVYWLNHFQWRELSGIRDEKTTAVIFPPDAKEEAAKIVDQISAARVMCPCYGKLYMLAGVIQWNLLDKATGIKNLNIGHDLRPGSAEAMYYLAQVEAADGRWSDAQEWGAKCFIMEQNYLDPLINLFVRQYHRPEVAYEALKSRQSGMYFLSLALVSDPTAKDVLVRTRQRLLELAKEETVRRPLNGDVWTNYAQRLQENGQQSEAVEAYRTSLTQDYANVTVRISLARLLINMGRDADAVKEVEICLRLKPQMDEAKVLLASLSAPKHSASP